jgi:murein DD-endopeptidase MepM/ murein hydrolase activator NlpD
MHDMGINLKPSLPNQEKGDQRDKDLRKACKEFESVFTFHLLKAMRRTVEKCDLFHGGQAEEFYESFLDQELSKNVAGAGHNSMASLLYRQLRRVDPSEMETGKDIGDYEEKGGTPPHWPLKAEISSGFGWRKDPVHGQTRFHDGIDLAAKEGTPVRASLPGRVILSDYQEGYGNLVVLDHGHGFTTLYAHNRDNLVKEGDWVDKGSPLGKVGSTGRSTGPHLHFEVRRHGRHLDPRSFLNSEA